MTKTKLLYLTTQDSFFLSHLKDRALFAKANGFEVVVAAQQTSKEHIRQIEELGISFFDTGIERQALNPISQIMALIRLVKIFQSVKPDISHHLGAKSIIYGTIASKIANLSPRFSIVNAPIGLGYVYAAKETKARFLRPLVQLMYQVTLNPQNSRVIFENPDDLNYFVQMGALDRNRATCIYGAGVDHTIFSPSENKNTVCTVVMASRLIKEKGVIDFVRAANILKAKSIPVRMQLVGEPDYGNPNSLSKEEFDYLKNSDSIECLGFQKNISSILKKAHVCCLPSYYREGLPRFLIEGACCGLAIVTTDTVGCREVIAEQNGFLIEPHDVEDLVDKISTLVKYPEMRQRMGERSRSLALRRFSSDLVCKQTLSVYQELLKASD